MYSDKHTYRLEKMDTGFATGSLIPILQYLGEVEGVERSGLGLLEGHDLDEEGPGREVSVGDGVEQVSNGVVGIGGGKAVGLLHLQVLDALVGLKEQEPRERSHDASKQHNRRGSEVKYPGTYLVVELAVDGLAVGVKQLKGVRAVAVHVAVAVGKTAVAEQEGHLRKQERGTSAPGNMKSTSRQAFIFQRYLFNPLYDV